MKIYHFGCANDRAGHFIHVGENCGMNPYCEETYRMCETNPWGYKIDADLCPKGPEIEGNTLLHQKDGWTIISFWDRSVDKRGKCNSNFFADGIYTFEEMVELAKKHFPTIWARFKFPIIQVK